MYYVYLLQSTSRPLELYVGSTINLKNRFTDHNLGKIPSTKRYRPWKLIYYEAYIQEHLARLREQRLKHNGNAMRELKKRTGIINQKPKSGAGFTLIELLVVIAIIALLSSVALIAFISARQKSRDAKRLSDMTQMSNAMELYFATNKGYPSGPFGIPTPLVSGGVANKLPSVPQPADGDCAAISYPSPPVPGTVYGAEYYYFPSGTVYLAPDGVTQVYPDYGYYFCLGNQTGNFSPGQHILTPKGLR